MRWKEYAAKGLGLVVLGWALSSFLTASTIRAQKAEAPPPKGEASNMELMAHDDIQGMPAYRPVVEKQGDRYFVYVGSQFGAPPVLNPVTGKLEPSGTMIVDVTDPRHPKDIAHIPSAPLPPGGEEFTPGHFPIGNSQYMRVCGGSELPHGEKGKYYMVRAYSSTAWEMWDVTDPAHARKMNDIITGITGNHEFDWECDTGIAYLTSGPHGWPVPDDVLRTAFVHLVIYDLSDPAKPVYIRDWGLPGQNPGSTAQAPHDALSTVVSTGPKGNRLYVSYGQWRDGIAVIVDREKLLKGPKEPTDDNLRYPVIARIDLPRNLGVHTAFPLLQMEPPGLTHYQNQKPKDFLAIVPQQMGNECKADDRQDGTGQMVRIYDITDESRPVGVATWEGPDEASGNFCSRGGRYGPHETQTRFDPIFYKRVMFVTYFNAGVRALDIRDPYQPKEIGYYVPPLTKHSGNACSMMPGEEKPKSGCDKEAIQTDHMDVDDRGNVYIVDRQGSGLDILQLTGAARKVANYPQK